MTVESLDPEALSATRDIVPAVTWIEDNFYARDEDTMAYGPVGLFPWQARVLADALGPNENGNIPYRTIIYSTPKKGGKTTVASAVAAWAAFEYLASDGEIYLFANSKDQAAGRLFKFLRRAAKANPALWNNVVESRGVQHRLILHNNTEVVTLAGVAKTVAGGNQDASFWDELWGYDLEADQETWGEMTPPPTRPNSFRFVSTYAGWEDRPGLLRPSYEAGIQGKRLYEDGFRDPRNDKWYDTPLPCYVVDDMYMYWDEGEAARRMPWQTKAYYAGEWRKVLRGEMSHATFRRLHLNQWGVSEEAFVPEASWMACAVSV